MCDAFIFCTPQNLQKIRFWRSENDRRDCSKNRGSRLVLSRFCLYVCIFECFFNRHLTELCPAYHFLLIVARIEFLDLHYLLSFHMSPSVRFVYSSFFFQSCWKYVNMFDVLLFPGIASHKGRKRSCKAARQP